MSLSQWNTRFHVGRKTNVADLHRFDADGAKNEFPLDGLPDTDVHDFAVARKRGDGILRPSERADVLIVEWRWLRRGRRGRRLRNRLLHDDGLRGGRRRRGRWLFVREKVALAPVAAARPAQ